MAWPFRQLIMWTTHYLLSTSSKQRNKYIYIYIYLFIYFVKGLLRHDGLVVFCVQGFNSQLITSVIILGSSV